MHSHGSYSFALTSTTTLRTREPIGPMSVDPITVNLPFVRRTIEIGSRTWMIETVEDQDALLRLSGDRPIFPFGLLLWEAAVALAAHIAANPEIVVSKTVLELGAGLGLTGVVAAGLGGAVTQTDHDASALAASARTAALNGRDGIVQETGNWHCWTSSAAYDVILGADVAYDSDDHDALLAVCAHALKPGGRAIFSDPNRECLSRFIAAIRAAGWHLDHTSRQTADLKTGAPRQIAILTLTKPD